MCIRIIIPIFFPIKLVLDYSKLYKHNKVFETNFSSSLFHIQVLGIVFPAKILTVEFRFSDKSLMIDVHKKK